MFKVVIGIKCVLKAMDTCVLILLEVWSAVLKGDYTA